MFIAILSTEFYLHGCHSLKDKRQRLRGLRDRFGGNPNMAVCESQFQDQWERSEYTFLSMGNDKREIESALAKVVDHCTSAVDGELTRHDIQWL